MFKKPETTVSKERHGDVSMEVVWRSDFVKPDRICFCLRRSHFRFYSRLSSKCQTYAYFPMLGP